MSKAIKAEEDFTTAMQQLSAEAEKTLPTSPMIVEDPPPAAEPVAEQIRALEKILLGKFEVFTAAMEASHASALDEQLRKIDEMDHLLQLN